MDPPALARRRGLASLFRRGPHDAEILRLAVPAFGALVAEPLFLLGDSAIVGRIGTVPLGGLGVASQVLVTLVNISIFLAYGTTAAVARQLGAGNRRAAIQQGIDGLWLAAGIGVAVLAAGWPLAPVLVHAFGASPAVTARSEEHTSELQSRGHLVFRLLLEQKNKIEPVFPIRLTVPVHLACSVLSLVQ